MILYIDDFDPNMNRIYKLLTEEYVDVTVVRNDDMTARDLLQMEPEAVIIGAGAGNAAEMENCMEAIRLFCGNVPVFGFGLGAQLITAALGGALAEMKVPSDKEYNTGFDTSVPVFEGIPQIICSGEKIVSSISPENLPGCLCITARDEYGRGLAVAHREYPVYGMCMSPVSLGEENCRTILSNFIELSR